MSAVKLAIVANVLLASAFVFTADASGQERKTWTIDPQTSPAKILRKRGTLQSKTQTNKTNTGQQSNGIRIPADQLSLSAASTELVIPTPPADDSSQLRLDMLPPLPLYDPAVQQAQYGEPLPTPLYADPGGLEEFEYGYDLPQEAYSHAQHQCDTRCRVEQYWARADYLYWWFEGAEVPPLITSSNPGTDRLDAGILGLPSTHLLLGNTRIGKSGNSGGRIEFGRWFPSRGNLGWHFAYMGIGEVEERYDFNSDTTPILARPFFSVEPGASGPNAELIALPGELEGNVSVLHSTSFDGAEFMFRQMLAAGPTRRLQIVAGYQYNGLDDELSIRDFKRVVGGGSGLAIGTTLAENDRFGAENQFHGAAIGVLASMRNCRWTTDLGMQMAFGTNRANVHVNGSTTSSVPVAGAANDVNTSPGGLLALGTNIGSYEKDSLSVIPQVHFGVGYDLHPQVRVIFGYRFLYWSQVARAAEQIDPGLNLTQLDPAGLNGDPRPRFDMKLTDFWAQGVNAGIDYRF